MNIDDDVKQVIVIRKDLRMRRGKEIAQGCHAAGEVLIELLLQKYPFVPAGFYNWLQSGRTKVCLQTNSEAELLAIKAYADEIGVYCHLVKDEGRTEFNGVPTYTCLALGPDYSEEIDKITGVNGKYPLSLY